MFLIFLLFGLVLVEGLPPLGNSDLVDSFSFYQRSLADSPTPAGAVHQGVVVSVSGGHWIVIQVNSTQELSERLTKTSVPMEFDISVFTSSGSAIKYASAGQNDFFICNTCGTKTATWFAGLITYGDVFKFVMDWKVANPLYRLDNSNCRSFANDLATKISSSCGTAMGSKQVVWTTPSQCNHVLTSTIRAVGCWALDVTKFLVVNSCQPSVMYCPIWW